MIDHSASAKFTDTRSRHPGAYPTRGPSSVARAVARSERPESTLMHGVSPSYQLNVSVSAIKSAVESGAVTPRERHSHTSASEVSQPSVDALASSGAGQLVDHRREGVDVSAVDGDVG